MKVSVEEIIEMEIKVSAINNTPLEDIEWTYEGKTLSIPKDTIDEWKFMGLSNKDFVNFHIVGQNGEVIKNEK